MPSLPGYAYAYKNDSVYVNLFIGGSAAIKMGENAVRLTQRTRYPWDGNVKITVEPESRSAGKEFAICVRIPGWAQNRPVPSDLYRYLDQNSQKATLKVNGQPVAPDVDNGFARIRRTWQVGDVIELNLPMPIRRVLSHEKIKDNTGCTAIQRGPVVYCFEGADNSQGIASLVLPTDAKLQTEYRSDLLDGIVTIAGQGKIRQPEKEGKKVLEDIETVAIPYYAWAHRGKNEMAVWLPASTEGEN
jgi:DUF1680 family protein